MTVDNGLPSVENVGGWAFYIKAHPQCLSLFWLAYLLSYGAGDSYVFAHTLPQLITENRFDEVLSMIQEIYGRLSETCYNR